jgi:hypothetical protein
MTRNTAFAFIGVIGLGLLAGAPPSAQAQGSYANPLTERPARSPFPVQGRSPVEQYRRIPDVRPASGFVCVWRARGFHPGSGTCPYRGYGRVGIPCSCGSHSGRVTVGPRS